MEDLEDDWWFRGSQIPALEIVERSRDEWMEFKEFQKRKWVAGQQKKPSDQQQLASQPVDNLVGYYTLYTSAIFQPWPLNSSFGILATNHQKLSQQAKAMIKQGSKIIQ